MDTPPSKIFGLKKSSHFKLALNKGEKWVTKSFVLIVAPLSSISVLNTHYPNQIAYGIVASKKVGNAVCRNKAKRRLRDIIRTHLPVIGSPDYILSYDFPQLPKDLKWSNKRVLQK